jgi:uncharacterized protein
MAVTMYSQSIPVLVKHLNALSGLLDKAAAHCEAHKIDPLVLTSYRLYPDMLPFTRQVMIAADMAKGAGGRLGGVEIPKYEDLETTLPELKARIAKTVAFLQSVPVAAVEASADKAIELPMRSGDPLKFTGHTYLNYFVLPNVYFHTATAYAILRHNGVPVGKTDYLA